MEFNKIANTNSEEFRLAWNLYEEAFPEDERRDLEKQEKIMQDKSYNFFSVKKDKKLIAIITDWNFDNFFFIEHLAVNQELRGKGIGTELISNYFKNNNKSVVLEVEKPETEIAARRIEFYKRLGFNLNSYSYIQPAYGKDKNPVPMLLMSYPDKISNNDFPIIRKRLHAQAYGLKEPLIKL